MLLVLNRYHEEGVHYEYQCITYYPPDFIYIKTIIPRRAYLSKFLILWVCLLLLSPPIFAHADTSMYTVTASCNQAGSTSQYLGGTLCGAGGGFTLNGPSTVTVTYMYLYVNGTMLDWVSSDQRAINQTNDGLAASFDSTHFNDGASVNVEFSVYFSDGSSITKTASSSAYNKAYIYGNDIRDIGILRFGEAAVLAVNAQMGSTNHTILPAEGQLARLKANIRADIPTPTVFYTWTHGIDGGFGDSSARQLITPQTWVMTFDISNAIARSTAEKGL